MRLEENLLVSASSLADLREAVGWNRMQDCYQNPKMYSYYHIAAYDQAHLIGYIDCVSNGVTDAYIQDLMVHPDYQGNGLGTQLMNRMISHLRDQNIYMVSVIYDSILVPFYQRFGFTQMLSGQLQTYECP